MAEKSDTPNKNWFARHKVLTSLLALVLIIIIATSLGGGNKNTANNSADTTNTATTKPAASTSKSTASTASSSSTTRKVTGTATTLGAGTFTGGTDVPVGLYNVTTSSGQSGNFIVTGTDNYDEILGVSDSQGVPSVRAQISKGDQIQISGLSTVIFTPVSSPYVTSHSAVTLGAGTWIVGQDLGTGRYVAAPASGQSGNFIVTGTDEYDDILGTDTSMDEVPTLTVTLSKGDIVDISGMYGVTMTPAN